MKILLAVPAARQAMIDIVPRGGRYLMEMEEDLTRPSPSMEGLDPASVMAFAGSSEPLHYTVLTFTDKSKPLVVADPGYEAPMWAAQGCRRGSDQGAAGRPQGRSLARHQGHARRIVDARRHLHLQPQQPHRHLHRRAPTSNTP